MPEAVLALGACLGARTGYWDATYMFAIYEPLGDRTFQSPRARDILSLEVARAGAGDYMEIDPRRSRSPVARSSTRR
jgi:hypothetical protein